MTTSNIFEGMFKAGLFVGPAPKGRDFTIISNEPNGTVTIQGVVADNGVIYITKQEWKPAKKYGKSVCEVAMTAAKFADSLSPEYRKTFYEYHEQVNRTPNKKETKE